MSALTGTLGADITALKRAMAGATELVGASAKRMGRLTGAGLAGLGKGGAVALQKGFSRAGIALKAGIGAALAGGAAAVGVGAKSVTAAANFEQTKVAFATLIGDAAKAEATLAKLRELGAETPSEFPELADAGRKLIAFGESAETVPETLRRIGDISAGVQAPVGEIAELYGKARVQGRLFAEDIDFKQCQNGVIFGLRLSFRGVLSPHDNSSKDLCTGSDQATSGADQSPFSRSDRAAAQGSLCDPRAVGGGVCA